jgi:hypothetical protein
MIEFADGKRSDVWGAENLDAGIAAFHLDGIWVVNRSGVVRYGVTRTPENESQRDDILTLPLTTVIDAVKKEPLTAFHTRIGNSIFSVVAAGIVPTADEERATKPQGYFVTISAMDNEYLAELGDSTGTTVELLPGNAPKGVLGLTDPEKGIVKFQSPLVDQNGTTIAQLHFERINSSLSVIYSQARGERLNNYILFTGLAILVLIVLTLNTRARQRAEAIASQITKELQDINATLEQRVRERTAELEEDIKQRTEAEEGLKKRTDELERLNKVMVDRELRVFELKRKLKETGGGEELV